MFLWHHVIVRACNSTCVSLFLNCAQQVTKLGTTEETCTLNLKVITNEELRECTVVSLVPV
jgi:hypothetical protein